MSRKKEKVEKVTTPVQEVLSLLVYIILALILALLLIKFVGQRTVVDGSSMEPMLQNQDNLIVDKLSYRFHDPERYDIVVFPPRNSTKTNIFGMKNEFYIKRIIGLPGETVQIKDGIVYINGEELGESYGREVILKPGRAAEPITLGDDEYFVMGDNRNHSSDSRTDWVGNVKRDELLGKAWARIWPLSKIGMVKHQ